MAKREKTIPEIMTVACESINSLPKVYNIKTSVPGIRLACLRAEAIWYDEYGTDGPDEKRPRATLDLGFTVMAQIDDYEIELELSPYILPDGSIDEEKYLRELPIFFRDDITHNIDFKNKLEDPVRFIYEIYGTILQIRQMCWAAANLGLAAEGGKYVN